MRKPVEQSRLDRYVFFVDRSLGKDTIAKPLREAGAKVEVHDDHFRQNEADEIWLTHAGQQGWVVLTGDKNIQRRPNEIMALLQAGVQAFVLVAKNLTGPAKGEILVKALPNIYQFLESHDPPFIAKITRDGTVSMVVPK